ncbi:hypothetical protein HMPREF0357_11313 [Erysipelothrix rhusiopathiae ATCC 19414]|uniref:Uncharacterized protein n=1 Tax=Erysipelothrix rhusiopathiae ATCC 19414 TaxID=525280 RepID=E7FXD6_ERYRH|nr:hypothetical protein HMPREF0357_11313 [Erysipelothrix rhusiopathiae ATCC 19414]
MHVLGTPPAFILSQDQTLHLILSLFNSDEFCLLIYPYFFLKLTFPV